MKIFVKDKIRIIDITRRELINFVNYRWLNFMENKENNIVFIVWSISIGELL